MNKEHITHLYQKGYLTDIDVHFAKFITGLSKNDDPDIFLASALASNATGNGDVYFDLASVAEKPLLMGLEDEGTIKWPKLSCWLQKIRKSPVVGSPGDYRPLILDKKNRLYLYRYWDYEKKLSESIINRSGEDFRDLNVTLLNDGLKRLFPQNTDNDFNWQMVAAYIAALKRFCIISGGPGTGKTFSMAKILALLLELSGKERLKILLAAPTGKAATRIAESINDAKKTLNSSPDIIEAIPSEAQTIHRMLKTIPGSPYFHHNHENPLDADVVVVDEASMIDLALMSKLLWAVPFDARLILMGDKDQLASVETGFVLGDICDRDNVHAFSKYFCNKFEEVTKQKIDLPVKVHKDKPGLYDCMVVLEKNYRFTGSSGIGELSRVVNRGEIDKALCLMKNSHDQIFWKEISQPNDLSHFLAERVIKGYSDYLNTEDPYKALELFKKFKILCAVKIGSIGVNAVNRLAEQVLIRAGLIEPDSSSSNPWYKGRPVLITRNDYSLKLFNGDMGITMPAPDSNSKDLYVYFLGDSGELRWFLPYRLPEHETVYAMTVHKSQGSEFDNVLLILPERDYPVLTRELFYTGITRARKTVSIWAKEDVLETTISRKIERTSGLKDALWG
ncbi:MAG: exodeoxyribonuclease V subunit alpha [Deltaproteobacteria bacterium]|nr:exodeoxyribonuclease V subunit alpha [Deltaproteobacteria bacterium]